MRVLLASTDPDLLHATAFSLECKGFKVTLLVPRRAIAAQLSESGADIVVLDVGFSRTRTSAIVEQLKDDQKFAGIVLILFSKSRSQLQKACSDRKVLNKADYVLVQMPDGSDLIDKIESAARFLRTERSQYRKESHDWEDPYAATYPEERREDECFKVNAPITIRGKDVLEEPFEEQTTMINSGAAGAYVKTEFHIENGADLEISVRDPQAPNGTFDTRGTVVRTELGGNGHESKRRRVAVRFADDVTQNIEFHLLLARLSAQAGKQAG
jgi:CheY-like chemotaxis protein